MYWDKDQGKVLEDAEKGGKHKYSKVICEQQEDFTSLVYLVNVIAHNCSGLVADYELVGLRFELESKTEDQTVDYRAFFGKLDAEEKEKLKALEKQDSKVADFEAVLLKICKLIQERESNIEHTFSVFTKQDGCIDPVRLRKLFEVIGFSCKDHEFDAIIQNAASRGENSILAFNLMR